MGSTDDVRDWVKSYYGETLKTSGDLQTNACCIGEAPAPWLRALLANVHEDVLSRFYGCGFPIAEALEGCTVLDLGCGTGRDAYLLAQLVGADGLVHGVDMTESQLAIAKQTEAWHQARFGFEAPNTRFHQGYIEDLSNLDIPSNSVDVVVSNCVVNLSPRKDLVLAEIYRVLKPGGEFYFSDVFADRRLPQDIATDPLLHSECLGGAMYDYDFLMLAKAKGFPDPRLISSAPITIMNDAIQRRVGAARFTSQTLRLFKLSARESFSAEGDLDPRCEDYGQVAIYRGSIPEHPALFALDDHHLFETGRPERVCRNTAAMLEKTRFKDHFQVIGDASTHYGLFNCSATIASSQYAATGFSNGGEAAPASEGSCSTGSCC